MTTAAAMMAVAGFQAVGNWFQPDTTQRHVLGTIINVTDPFYGGQELVYVSYSFTTATALKAGTVLAVDTVSGWTATNVANTANLGKPVAFVLNGILASAATGVYYMWAVIAGQTPVWCNNSAAADSALYLVAAGQGSTTVAAGKAFQGLRVSKAAAGTVVKAGTYTVNGSPIIKVQTTDGWFLGVSVSGTGIATSLITAIDPDNRTVTLASNSTATGSVSATGTLNDGTNFFNICTFNRPSMEGIVT